MGDFNTGTNTSTDLDQSQAGSDGQFQNSQQRTAFHSQFDGIPRQQWQPPGKHFVPTTYDMSTMAAALPPLQVHDARYQMAHSPQHPAQRSPTFDPMFMRAAQQQHYLAQQYNSGQGMPSVHQRQHDHYNHVDPFVHSMPPYSPIDPRFAPQPMYPAAAQARRASEAAPVPSFPRGPPRKPKQSGHALWVGNLPPAATVTDLKDHFSRNATKDIESLFLISKSNCAFVNYRSEAACVAAMNRFHDSRFHGVRLVCRLRRGSTSSTAPPTVDASRTNIIEELTKSTRSPTTDDTEAPLIVSTSRAEGDTEPTADRGEQTRSDGRKATDVYFIVKSLTVQDLESSVRNGIWATQSHNEKALNLAYENVENVYLIFSANKSGEYFGYARMASPISGELINLNTMTEPTEEGVAAAGTPFSRPTPATDTAPKGRIIDDSARGTIFWEADLSADESGAGGADGGDTLTPQLSHESAASSSSVSEEHWGRQFKIEWLSTARLPFFRTRGLRNPWNANREVKIARDGTELEPSVGRRLIQMFHQTPQQQQPPPQTLMGLGGAPGMAPMGIPFR